MLKGKVKWFDAKKGFGFIVDQDGKEIIRFINAPVGVIYEDVSTAM